MKIKYQGFDNAIKMGKNGKSPGQVGINLDILKHGGIKYYGW